MNGGCQSEGRKPGRGTHALRLHVLRTGAFCHQVREWPFTQQDESVRMRYRSGQRSIIGKFVKNTSPEIAWARFQTTLRPKIELTEKATPVGQQGISK